MNRWMASRKVEGATRSRKYSPSVQQPIYFQLRSPFSRMRDLVPVADKAQTEQVEQVGRNLSLTFFRGKLPRSRSVCSVLGRSGWWQLGSVSRVGSRTAPLFVQPRSRNA